MYTAYQTTLSQYLPGSRACDIVERASSGNDLFVLSDNLSYSGLYRDDMVSSIHVRFSPFRKAIISGTI